VLQTDALLLTQGLADVLFWMKVCIPEGWENREGWTVCSLKRSTLL